MGTQGDGGFKICSVCIRDIDYVKLQGSLKFLKSYTEQVYIFNMK